ncbi:glutaredoxin-C1-like [Asparagus officinalis]|uniref:glutaredoxin-C1-like n=1 Tax=Asparagus officinalis TaxID=4686 RepID=UPI00098E167F|nr:glutaredoxin-C1-like [Asparagus officinalis]
MDTVMRLASQKAVVIFSMSSCCMSHTVKTLFRDLGVNPAIYELDEEPMGKEMEAMLSRILSHRRPVPVVFIGGKLIGSTEKVMSLHLAGSLVPMLHDAGALWL